jgi:ABC-type nickel/cobalt efflux system permease component RcnA
MFGDIASISFLLTALVIGITHTLIGPDHYLPFVALGKARHWSSQRTLMITFLCGLGHVCGSVILGAIGIAAGWNLGRLEAIESIRGNIAAWLLTAFGFVYLVWALKRIGNKKDHTHLHVHHINEGDHCHEHTNQETHAHIHILPDGKKSTVTAWSLFIIFVFGPCEAFIPLMLFPAFQQNGSLSIYTTLVFAFATIGTMMGCVYLIEKGLSFTFLNSFSRFAHVAAGATILTCGTAIHLGL